MAYDPADLRLPGWLLRFLDVLIRIRLPFAPGWSIGMTRPGVMFVLALFGVWGAAFYSGNNLLYLCASVLLVICVAAVIQGVRLLHRFPAFETLMLPVLEVNQIQVIRQALPMLAGVAAMVRMQWHNMAGDFELSGRCTGGQALISGRLQPAKRGLFEVGAIRLSSEAPLGLFGLAHQRSGKSRMVVMPSSIPWQAAGGRQAEGQGLRDGDEWRDLRSYVPGDPLSRVHWRKAASNVQTDRFWTVKRFASGGETAAAAYLRVDLRMPVHLDEAAFEQLLGKAWFWLQQYRGQTGGFVLGQQAFDTADEASVRQAMAAIAASRPGHAARAGEGPLLSIIEGAA